MHRYFDISGRGHRVRCKLYCRSEENIRRVVIFGHGFGGHKDNGAAEKFAKRLTAAHEDAALITFNWPAHGDDDGQTLHLEDCLDYLALVVDHARQTYNPAALCSYATSFGGYLTLMYIHTRENPFEKIALRCPAVNMYDVLTGAIMSPEELARLQKGESVPVGFDRKVTTDPPLLRALQSCDIQTWDFRDQAGSLLILHGSADEIVPFAASRAFAERNSIAFIPVEGADHRFREAEHMEEAIRHILAHFAW